MSCHLSVSGGTVGQCTCKRLPEDFSPKFQDLNFETIMRLNICCGYIASRPFLLTKYIGLYY